MDDPQFNASDDADFDAPLIFYNLEDGIPPGSDADVLNEIMDAMDFPAEDRISEVDEDEAEELENLEDVSTLFYLF